MNPRASDLLEEWATVVREHYEITLGETPRASHAKELAQRAVSYSTESIDALVVRTPSSYLHEVGIGGLRIELMEPLFFLKNVIPLWVLYWQVLESLEISDDQTNQRTEVGNSVREAAEHPSEPPSGMQSLWGAI